MSRHRLSARLDRLERAHRSATVKGPDRAPFFPIDSALAKSLRDDYERLWKLRCRDSSTLGAAELEEKERLQVSIADRARTIDCPVDYGPIQSQKDADRLHQLSSQRQSTRCGPLTDAEDAEEAQLRARLCAYEESPESRDRQRIRDLRLKQVSGSGCSPAEQEELDRLRKLYPPALRPDPRIEPLLRSAAFHQARLSPAR